MELTSKISIAILFVCVYSLDAQTIDTTFFPEPGVVIENKSSPINNEFLHPIPSSGDDQVWDYSQVWNISEISNETSWVVPEEGEYWEQMDRPTILKIEKSGALKRETYLSTQGDTVFLVGIAYSSTNIVTYDLGERIFMPAGLNIYEQFSNPVSISYYFAGVGTLITPRDTFENVYMIREDYFQPQYKWYHENLNKEVASYTPPFNATVAPLFTWMDNYEISAISNIENKYELLSNLEVIKVNNRIQIINSSGSLIKGGINLLTMDGKTVLKQSIDIEVGVNDLDFALEKFPNGIYNVVILDKKSGRLNNFKLVF